MRLDARVDVCLSSIKEKVVSYSSAQRAFKCNNWDIKYSISVLNIEEVRRHSREATVTKGIILDTANSS